jgi:malate dehydrogenase
MERRDLLLENGSIFVEQGRALDAVADRNVRVLVVGNPCNTNCLIAIHHAPSLNPSHFAAMTRLDENRARSALAAKAGRGVSEVSRLVIWGNHSSTQVPDYFHARVGEKRALEAVPDRSWFEGAFVQKVQKRGAEVIAARGGKSSAASAAHAALYAMRALLEPTAPGDWFSSALFSNGNPYGIAKDLVFSFPCVSQGRGDAAIVEGLDLPPELLEKIRISEKELIDERSLVAHLLNR